MPKMNEYDVVSNITEDTTLLGVQNNKTVQVPASALGGEVWEDITSEYIVTTDVNSEVADFTQNQPTGTYRIWFELVKYMSYADGIILRSKAHMPIIFTIASNYVSGSVISVRNINTNVRDFLGYMRVDEKKIVYTYGLENELPEPQENSIIYKIERLKNE